MGGDITGKAIVPIIRRRDQWDTTMFDQHAMLRTEAEVADIERKIRNRGYYPVRIGRLTSARTAIERVQPLLGLHGHISTKAGEQ